MFSEPHGSQLPLIRELPAKETQEGEAPVKEEHICEKHEIISSLLQSTWSCLQEILEVRWRVYYLVAEQL